MQVCSFDGSVCGYGDIAGPYTPAIEFTAQVASAGIKDTDFVMQQISSLPDTEQRHIPWRVSWRGRSLVWWSVDAVEYDDGWRLAHGVGVFRSEWRSSPQSVHAPLTVTKVGTGSGTVTSSPAGISCPTTCSASFTQGQSVTLSATAASGSTFQGWSGEWCSGAGTCTVTLTGDLTVTASFTSNTQGMSSGGGGGGCTIRPGAGFDPTLVGIMGSR